MALDLASRLTMTSVTARALPQSAACPYCGQPITARKLDEIRDRIRAKEAAQLKALEQRLRAELATANRAEAARLATRASELAAREQALAERAKALEVAARARYDEGYRKARVEAARIQQQLQKQVDDLKRRLEHKTADELGAVPEEDLVEVLRRAYPDDAIERVPRGTAGADVLHEVRHRGQPCGRIVYESKNVRQFLTSFLDRARGYRARYDTPYVVLATTAFPAGERDFCVRDGVILVHPGKVTYVVEVLRTALIALAGAAAAGEERATKGARLLAYVASDEFKERLRGVLAAVDDLRSLQAEERKRHERTWGLQEEAHRAIEKFTGRIQVRVGALVEGREPGE